MGAGKKRGFNKKGAGGLFFQCHKYKAGIAMF